MAGGKKRQCPTNTLQQKGLEFFFNRQRKRQQQLEKTSDSNAADEEKLVLRQPKPHESTAQIDPLIQKPSTASAAVQDHKTVEGKDGTTLMKQQLPLTQLAMSTSVAAHDNLHELLLKDPMVFKPEEYHVQTWMTATGVFAPYSVLAQTFAIIMSTTARTRMINVLCNLLRLLIFHAPADLLPALWLCSNSIGPSYEGAELGIGSHILIKSLADVSGTTPRQLRKLYETHGDWGDVAYAAKTSVRTIVEPQPLCIRGVLDTLHTVAASRGKGVVGTKTAAVKKLLLAAKGEEARFIVRTLIGNLRVGALRTTVLTSLARACVLTQSQDQTEGELIRHKDDNTERILFKLKRAEAVLKECYAQCPNWNAIVPWLLECGDVSRIFECCGLTVGKCIPLKPMLGQITRELADVFVRLQSRDFACEWKYDGQRAQIHMDEKGHVALFSRNLENMTDKYPDVTAIIPHICSSSTKSFIMDAEIVAVDEEGNILPFQILSNRSRKNVTVENISIHVCVLAFDLMYINDESLLQQSLRERRIRLKEHFTPLRTKFDFVATMDASGEDIFHEKVQEFFRHSICHGSEGIMVKVLDHPGVILQDQSQRGKPKRHLLATYEPDKRVENWLKVKKDYVEGISDTLDLIPIGAWYGNGRKVNWYSPILMACYNPENETLESVCKCMSGKRRFSDKFYEEMKEFYSVENNRILSSPRQDYVTDLQPDVWFDACQVWEIKGADVTISPVHKGAIGLIDESKGLSLRFPRFLKIRDDKALEDATSSDMLASLYLQQQQQPKEEESRVSIDAGESETLAKSDQILPLVSDLVTVHKKPNKFEEYGAVHDFIAMKGFGRLMIIYEETMSAMAAREAMDKTTLLWKAVGQEVDMLTLDNEMELEESMMAMAIRIYYGQHNPINPDPNLMRLQIPDPGRNFLISPPGAPFEDWKQTQESPPNKAVLASDLMHAVADVSDDDVDDLEDFSLDRSDNDDDRFTPTLKIVLGEEPAEHLPVITVQDFDGVKGELDTTKKNNRLPFPKATVMPTPRPPLFS